MFEAHNQRKDFYLYGGQIIPSIGYGTGVIRQYSRNPYLFVRDNIKPLLRSIKNFKLDKKIYRDWQTGKILQQSIDIGYRLFDSGRIYGYSEREIGRTIKRRNREDFYLVSKISDMDLSRKFSPDTVSGNLSITLKNLHTEFLDLYLLHYPHGDWYTIYKEMENEYKSGRVKAIGICNCEIQHLKELEQMGAVKPMVCQIECHPFYGRYELRKYCMQNNIIVMAHTPTARMCEKVLENGLLNDLALKYHASITQIILRWHYQNGVIPICHSLSTMHLIENYNIMNFQLNEKEMKMIEALNEDYVLLPGNGIDNANYIYNF